MIYANAAYHDALGGLDVAELLITSGASLEGGEAPADAFRLEDVAGVAVVPGLAGGTKCGRCWRVLPEVGADGGREDLCGRCDDAVGVAAA